MSDTSLPVIIRFDTAANRAAFTPNPGASEQLYIWLDSDDQPNSFYWDGAAWQPFAAGAGSSGITELTGEVTAGPGSGAQAATIAANAVVTAKILNANVTYAKIQNVSATDRLLGRDTAGAGVIEELTASNGIEFNGAPGVQLATAQRTRTITIDFDGGGSVIPTNTPVYIRVPVALTLTEWTILAQDGLTGSIAIDIWNDTYANFPPTDADSITGGNEPEVVGDIKDTDNTAGFADVTIPAGSILGFNVDSVTTFTHVTLQLTATVD